LTKLLRQHNQQLAARRLVRCTTFGSQSNLLSRLPLPLIKQHYGTILSRKSVRSIFDLEPLLAVERSLAAAKVDVIA
jgi:hypothetical protein